jgi:hypothetical protein
MSGPLPSSYALIAYTWKNLFLQPCSRIDLLHCNFFFNCAAAPSGTVEQGLLIIEAWLSHFIVRHTTIGRAPLDEWSASRRDLYLTTHNTHKTQTSMTPAGFKHEIPASARPQTHALDRAATGIGCLFHYVLKRAATLSFLWKVDCKATTIPKQRYSAWRLRTQSFSGLSNTLLTPHGQWRRQLWNILKLINQSVRESLCIIHTYLQEAYSDYKLGNG